MARSVSRLMAVTVFLMEARFPKRRSASALACSGLIPSAIELLGTEGHVQLELLRHIVGGGRAPGGKPEEPAKARNRSHRTREILP